MGCDGGTIPRRDELVKVKKKPEAKDKDSELSFQWRHCCITQQLLKPPIVMCGLGRLYNKESLIEALINRDTLPETAYHIKNLKDVRTLNLTINPAHKNTDKREGSLDNQNAPYICPVIGLEMSGNFRFIGLWSCGCVFSERALKEIKASNCHKCQKPFREDDVVVLNGTDEDMSVMKYRLEKRKQELKKNKEKKVQIKVEDKSVEVQEISEPSTSCQEPFIGGNVVVSKQTEENTSVMKQNMEKSKQELKKNKEKKAQIKVEDKSVEVKEILEPSASKAGTSQSNQTLQQKRPGAVINGRVDVRLKKIKSEYSVARDPNASDVYKSLFTSHKSEKEQNRAHWVTYNPFYN